MNGSHMRKVQTSSTAPPQAGGEVHAMLAGLYHKIDNFFFLCTYVDQMIIQQRFNVLLQLQFYNIFTNVLSKVFTDILKIYELPKIYNKKPKYCQTFVLTIIIYQANSMSQLHLAFELYPC